MSGMEPAIGFYAVISYRLGHHLPLAPAALFLYELWGPGLSVWLSQRPDRETTQDRTRG
jgi:hypothetical protein